MITKIEYENKETKQTSPVAEKYKVTSNNMNEIKSVVNNNANELTSVKNAVGDFNTLLDTINGEVI